MVSVDLGAPSPNIRTLATGNGYLWGGGTSSATPHVSGVAALLRTLHPSWTYSQIKAQILSTVDPLPSLAGKVVTGGRLNAAAALSTSSIHVSDPEILEGNSGTTDLVFTVSRRGDTSGTVTFDWSTVDGTATAGTDYVATSGTVQFLASETSKTITVPVNGDTDFESDETMFVDLTLVAGATTIADMTAQGTILQDDIADPIYVYDIRFDSKRGGKDWRAVFEIRTDSNANGIGDSGDDVVAGVAIEVSFAGQTYSGVTDANGVFRTSWIRNLGSGDHYANAVDLALTGYGWDPLDLDLEDDTDLDGRPDELLPL